ncbi:MAG: BON domain-containing protein [Elusimicrobiota bacterium]
MGKGFFSDRISGAEFRARARAFILLAGFAAMGLLAGCQSRMSGLDLSDPGITARVEAELKARPEISLRYMEINTHMRVVTLSGIARSHEEKRTIAAVVRRVPGVRQVIVNLLVQE